MSYFADWYRKIISSDLSTDDLNLIYMHVNSHLATYVDAIN